MISKSIYIRADGNSKIGLGHIVRCNALACMLKEDFDVKFFCRDIPELLENDIMANGIRIEKIQNEDEFINALSNNIIVVLDMYNLIFEYQLLVKEKAYKLVCIDDLQEGEFCADLIINHAPGIKSENYKTPTFTKFALGLDYALLRSAFLEQAKIKRNINKLENLLICFGGSDYKNLTQSTLNIALEFPDIRKIIVVTGEAYHIENNFCKLLESDNRIVHLHGLDENQMIDALLQAEIAVVSASGILFETIACGLISISGIYIENQTFVYNNFSSMGLIIEANKFELNNLRKSLKYALKSEYIIKKPIDGNSSKRLKYLFFELVCTLREAGKNDCELLFNWANDFKVRTNSISKDPILWENHEKWFFEKINSDKSKIYILEIAGNPVGQIRFDYQNNSWVIDYSISSEMRGKGLGKILVNMSLPYFKGYNIAAFVHVTNYSSQAVFNQLNFIKTSTIVINSELYFEYTKLK